MRLIDADALPRRVLKEKRFVFTMYDRINNEYIVETVYKDLADFINEAPTIDAEPVRHGRWEKICTSYWRWKHDGAHVVNRFKYKHNDCGKVVEKAEPYCPKCGAKMDGGAC